MGASDVLSDSRLYPFQQHGEIPWKVPDEIASIAPPASWLFSLIFTIFPPCMGLGNYLPRLHTQFDSQVIFTQCILSNLRNASSKKFSFLLLTLSFLPTTCDSQETSEVTLTLMGTMMNKKKETHSENSDSCDNTSYMLLVSHIEKL